MHGRRRLHARTPAVQAPEDGDWTYGLLVLAEGGVDDTHVEQDLGGVGDGLELPKRIVEFIVVVTAEGRDPCLDFL